MLPPRSWAVGVLGSVCTEVGTSLLGSVACSSKGGSVPPGAPHPEIPPPPPGCTPGSVLRSDPAFPIPQGLEAHKYKSTWDCAYQIMKHEGPLA